LFSFICDVHNFGGKDTSFIGTNTVLVKKRRESTNSQPLKHQIIIKLQTPERLTEASRIGGFGREYRQKSGGRRRALRLPEIRSMEPVKLGNVLG
jgi:hypothetical protein